jgi:copper(I)-binding protein
MLKSFKTAVLAASLTLAPLAASAQSYALGALRIDHAWSRPNPPGAPTAVGYMTITNTGRTPDRLVGAVSPEAASVEVHQMTMAGGVMRMRPLSGGLPIPASQTVRLAPVGYHLMLIGPKHAFRTGERILAILRFEHAGQVKVELLVQASPPADDAQAHPEMSHMNMSHMDMR